MLKVVEESRQIGWGKDLVLGPFQVPDKPGAIVTGGEVELDEGSKDGV